MKHFKTIQRLDAGILYVLELTASLSVLLLAFGLIASMANVLTEGSVLSNNVVMQRIWAWSQCVAIDASVAGAILRTFNYYASREWIKTGLYAFLSLLLLFTAAIVSNIESVQQTLNLSLERAYAHVFIPVEGLIWIRSFAIMLLIVAHAMRHVGQPEPPATLENAPPTQPSAPQILTDELLRAALAQVTVTEEVPQALPSPRDEQGTNTTEYEGEQGANSAQEASGEHSQEQGTAEGEQGANNYERVKAFLATHPEARDRDIAEALNVSSSTANKWRKRVETQHL